MVKLCISSSLGIRQTSSLLPHILVKESHGAKPISSRYTVETTGNTIPK